MTEVLAQALDLRLPDPDLQQLLVLRGPQVVGLGVASLLDSRRVLQQLGRGEQLRQLSHIELDAASAESSVHRQVLAQRRDLCLARGHDGRHLPQELGLRRSRVAPGHRAEVDDGPGVGLEVGGDSALTVRVR